MLTITGINSNYNYRSISFKAKQKVDYSELREAMKKLEIKAIEEQEIIPPAKNINRQQRQVITTNKAKSTNSQSAGSASVKSPHNKITTNDQYIVNRFRQLLDGKDYATNAELEWLVKTYNSVISQACPDLLDFYNTVRCHSHMGHSFNRV